MLRSRNGIFPASAAHSTTAAHSARPGVGIAHQSRGTAEPPNALAGAVSHDWGPPFHGPSIGGDEAIQATAFHSARVEGVRAHRPACACSLAAGRNVSGQAAAKQLAGRTTCRSATSNCRTGGGGGPAAHVDPLGLPGPLCESECTGRAAGRRRIPVVRRVLVPCAAAALCPGWFAATATPGQCGGGGGGGRRRRRRPRRRAGASAEPHVVCATVGARGQAVVATRRARQAGRRRRRRRRRRTVTRLRAARRAVTSQEAEARAARVTRAAGVNCATVGLLEARGGWAA